MHATMTLAALAGLLAAGCAADSIPPTDDAPPAAVDDGELAPFCADVDEVPYDPPPAEQPEPDLSLTHAEVIDDVDVGNDHAEQGMAIDQAQAWAEREAGDAYAGVWQDNQHDALVFAFTEDVETYAAALRERFGDGLWVVELPVGQAELLALTDELGADHTGWDGDDGPPAGALVHWGPAERLGRVTIGVYEPDDERRAELAGRYGAERICVEDSEPAQNLSLEVPAEAR